jgi:hypothetical protein
MHRPDWAASPSPRRVVEVVQGPSPGPTATPSTERPAFTFCLCLCRSVHGPFISKGRILRRMGDFMAVLGTIAFVVVMLGLIWGLEHV